MISVRKPLQKIVRHLESERARIDRQLAAVRAVLAPTVPAAPSKPPRRRWRMTVAQRRAISVRMTRYWAKRRRAA